ncbi:Protein polybromo-1, partial [Coemansia sp. RSA 2530]
MKVAMITKIRLGGPYERRKFFDGRWFLTPSEVPEIAGQPVYPHQLFAGPAFDSLGVRSVAGKCFILLPNVYARVYPQGFNAQDIYVCESMYEPGSDGQPGTLTPITNWAHDFKTPLMRPPAFISYIVPFAPNKQTVELWNNTSLLPHMGLTVLNREAVAKMQQAQSLARSQSQQQTPTRPPNVPRSSQPMVPQSMAMGGGASLVRPPNGMQMPPMPNNFAQAQQALSAHHQQNLAMAQSQQTQRENRIRKQASDQIAAAQQQNPSFIGSQHHQAIVRQKTQLIEQSQQAFFTQTHQLQQVYNQQLQALSQT